MRHLFFILALAYAFMLGTVYANRGGGPYHRCAKIEETNFYSFLSEFNHGKK